MPAKSHLNQPIKEIKANEQPMEVKRAKAPQKQQVVQVLTFHRDILYSIDTIN
jgi:hypothetical protein